MPVSLLANIARLNKLRGSLLFLCMGPCPKTDGSLDPQNKQKTQKPRILQRSELYNCLPLLTYLSLPCVSPRTLIMA